ncbi:hypothetical protein [Runella sp.]|uniref:hypothetical protein n=1 Tax=Runella sp. TaxID=1960881 RepID=UPI003D12F73F
MKKAVKFGTPLGQDFFENKPDSTLNKSITENGIKEILARFEEGAVPITNARQGYIFPEEVFRRLVKNVDGKKIEGVAVKFALNSVGHLHLVFLPIEKQPDGSYTVDYADAETTYQSIPSAPDPILSIPPHGA